MSMMDNPGLSLKAMVDETTPLATKSTEDEPQGVTWLTDSANAADAT